MEPLTLLVGFFTQFGYLAVFSVLLACGFGLPVPEDVTLVAGGIISGLGYTHVATMTLVGLAGVLIGDGLVFFLGRIYGHKVFEFRWISRFMTPARLKSVESKLARHGRWVVFTARFMPGLRTPIFLTTGATRQVSMSQFFMLDGLAALISVPLWIYLGYAGAERREWLTHWIQRGQTVTLTILITAIVGFILYQTLKKRNAKRCRT
jgi:membrane protein DedA with SNARE-associated domain